ncbi:methyltransferase domain-containing protein [Pedobacter polaris]|uniref:Methyltransferase domain-containing protein n=1 Tax=Pedobacter polaris TaxID=2571273 RepID=A0A4U1CKX0_9SPHI|nr:methyltransferase domain-containing protein [Pedobacter polaris]TKC08300.1 methyltransferase domain-containing protein [Pedobacter polaris]
MAWNPKTYNQFKTERYAPFYDILDLIEIKPNLKVIDLGCGTGELTSMLAEKLPNAKVLGVDSSIEMLNEAKAFASETLSFKQNSIEEQIDTNQKWDLIFSNAAIQWVDDHETLFPKIIRLLNPNGQLAIQMPSQTQNALNQILDNLVQEEPYQNSLLGYHRTSPVLKTDAYAQLLFEGGAKTITVFEKIYPIIAKSSNDLYDFISGSALPPYLEKLNGEMRENFIAEYKKRIQTRFPKSPTLYPFKRIIIAGKF